MESIRPEEPHDNADDREELEPLVLLEDESVESFKQDKLVLLDFFRIIASAALGTRGPFTTGELVACEWGPDLQTVSGSCRFSHTLTWR